MLGVSVVFGRTGGDISSPNMSMVGAGFGVGTEGCLEDEDAR